MTSSSINESKPDSASLNESKPDSASLNESKPDSASLNESKPDSASLNESKPDSASLNESKPDSPSVIIVGSGPAGWTAAIYLARAGLQPWLFEGELDGVNLPGGQLMTTTEVENYPGFPTGGVSGWDLMDRLKAQGIEFGTVLMPYRVTKISLGKNHEFIIDASNQKTYVVSAVILATGATAKYLGLPSEKLYLNRGVSACATCDGALPRFRNKPIVVVGGGDTAMEEALFLSKFGSQVFIVHRRDKFRASPIMIQRTLSHPKIQIIWNSMVEEICGSDELGNIGVLGELGGLGEIAFQSIENKELVNKALGTKEPENKKLNDNNVDGVRCVVVRNLIDNSLRTITCSGVFVAIGHQPNSDLVIDLVEVDSAGYIQTLGKSTATKTAGLFACGDVMDHTYRQAITAAGSGCSAAIDCTRWLELRSVSIGL